MKKLSLIIIAVAMLSMSIYASAAESNVQSVMSEESSVIVSDIVFETSEVEETEEQGSDVECSGPIVLGSNQMNANGNYDDKYHADYKGWCETYEYLVESYLGIVINPLDPDGKKKGINPNRTEPWWDEWIAEMLSEGLIEQAWYDEMIAKGYIIEVD